MKLARPLRVHKVRPDVPRLRHQEPEEPIGAFELKQLRYFVAVAEEMHFGRAAARLHMTQPPLSQQIHKMEKTLRVRLFERTKRGVLLTEAGLLLLQQARLLLAQSASALATLQCSYHTRTPRLSIGLCPAANLSLVSSILRSYGRRFPQVRLRVYELEAADQIVALRQGQIDLGFIRLPVADEALIVEPLLNEPLVLAVPESDELARAGPLPLSALADRPLIFLPRRCAPAYYDAMAALCRRAGFALDPSHEAIGPRAALSLAAAGLGLTLLPASAIQLAVGGVVFVDLKPPAPRMKLGIACRPEDRSQVLRAMLGMIREFVRTDHMPADREMRCGGFAPAPSDLRQHTLRLGARVTGEAQ